MEPKNTSSLCRRIKKNYLNGKEFSVKHQLEVAIIIQARLSSERCPRKMVRSFAGTTLLDIALQKLVKSKIPNKNIWCSVYEDELKEVCQNYPINIFHRSEKSSKSEGTPLVEIFEWWNKIPAKYVMMVNACCPFITVETIEQFFFDYLKTTSNGMFGVIEKKNYFWNVDGSFLTPLKSGVMNTKTTQPVLEAAHCLYAGSLEEIGKEVWMGDFGKQDDIELWKMLEQEVFDIDYEWQFQLYEELYKQRILNDGK